MQGSIAKCFVCMGTSEENGVTNEAILLERLVSSILGDYEVVKEQWHHSLLNVKCSCFVRKPS